MYGPKYENGEWKSRTNRELEEMSKGENIVKWIKGQRISWLGHLERMEEDRMPKKIFTQELEGTRRRGRARKRWKEEVERDLQVMGVRRWRELVADGKKCSTDQSPQWAVMPVEEEKVPLQVWSVPEGSRKLRFPDFMTPPPLPPGNAPGTHFC